MNDDIKDNDLHYSTERRPIGDCGKVCMDKKTAVTKKNELLKQGKEKYLRVYQCPICNYWHMSSRKYYNGKKFD